MIFWYLIIIIASFSPFLVKKFPSLYLITLAIAVSSDINGINVNNKIFTGFSFFVLSHILILITSLKYKFNEFKYYIKNQCKENAYKWLIFSLLISLIVGLYEHIFWKDINILLIIKPFIMVIQSLIIGYFITKNILLTNKRIIQIALYISLFNLAIIVYQAYGPIWILPATSTTYGINEIRIFGDGSRPYGLSREPAHLIILEMLCLISCINCSRNIYMILIAIIWGIIGIISDTRVLLLGIILFCTTYILLIDKNKIIKISSIITLSILTIILINVNERFESILSINADESTFIRYGSILSILYYYLLNFNNFFGLNNGLILLCENHDNIINLNQSICAYKEGVINWTVNYLTSLPYFILYIFTFIMLYKSDLTNKLLIIAILLSGMVFYIWSFPGTCMLLIIGYLLNTIKLKIK